MLNTPGVEGCMTVVGFSLLSGVANTYSAFFFVPFKPWDERTGPDEKYAAIRQHIDRRACRSSRKASPSPSRRRPFRASARPAAFTFVLEDRAARSRTS